MAKGLFTVFSDTSAPPASSGATASGTKRRALAGKGALGGGLATTKAGKENLDPFSFSAHLGKPPLGMGKKALGSGGGSVNKLAPAPLPSSSLSSSAGPFSKTIYRPTSTSTNLGNSNAICTGTLRTRELPSLSLPPLSPAPRSHTIHLPPSSPAFSTLSLDSPSSARDSGYARSAGSVEGCCSGGESEGDEDDEGQMVAWRREEDRTVVLESLGDRRARALTESPLAEVTGAYTSNGAFTLPLAAPGSPSPLSSAFPHQSAAKLRPRPATHSKPHPQKIAPAPTSAGGGGYSTSQTTRKCRPTPSGAAPPSSSSGLRF